MTRRDFLGSAAVSAAPAFASAAKPNIVFILADDLGYGDLGCYGQQRIRTPHLDRLAGEGTRFTQAYSGSTVCAPSRCCLMTGKHTGHATVRGNRKPELGLAAGEVPAASLLRSAGYHTALIGKWGLGGFDMNSHPNDKGFDEFFGYLDQGHAHLSYPEHLWENKSEHFLKGNWFNRRREFSNDLFTGRAVSFIEKRDSAPFFLYLSYTIPHANNELGQIQANGMENPDHGPYGGEDWPDVEKTFAASITRMDSGIGRVLEALNRKGLDENTLVLYSSDNGPHKEGNHNAKFFSSSGPLRGTKRDLYEGGIRVPALARWKTKSPAGRVSDFPWAFWDFVPTAAELAGVPVPGRLDGQSIVPALLGRAQQPHDFLYWEFFEGGFQQALRQGDWKLVRQAPGFRPELFNLREDAGETRDLAARHPEILARLSETMRSARTENPNFPVAAR